MGKKLAGEEGPEMVVPISSLLGERKPVAIPPIENDPLIGAAIHDEPVASDARTAGDSGAALDEALRATGAKVADLHKRFGADRISCQACGSDALPFDHPRGFYACGRCGSLQQNSTTLRADYEAKVAVLTTGETLVIGGPFRGQRSLPTLRERTIDSTYLLERAGAMLLMLSLGMALHDDDNRTLTFIKG